VKFFQLFINSFDKITLLFLFFEKHSKPWLYALGLGPWLLKTFESKRGQEFYGLSDKAL
jgi:hypothetical protein